MRFLARFILIISLSSFLNLINSSYSFAVDYFGPNIEHCPGTDDAAPIDYEPAYMFGSIPFSTSATSIQLQNDDKYNANVKKIYYEIYDELGKNLLNNSFSLSDSPGRNLSASPMAGITGYPDEPRRSGFLLTSSDTGVSVADSNGLGFNSTSGGEIVDKSYSFGVLPDPANGRLLLPFGENSIFENVNFVNQGLYSASFFQPNKKYVFNVTAYNYINESDLIDARKCVRDKRFLVATDIADVFQTTQTNTSVGIKIKDFPTEVDKIEYRICRTYLADDCIDEWADISTVDSAGTIATFSGLAPNSIYSLLLRFYAGDTLLTIENQKFGGPAFVSPTNFNDNSYSGEGRVAVQEDPRGEPTYVAYEIATTGEFTDPISLGTANYNNEYISQFYINSLMIKGDGLENYAYVYPDSEGIFDFSTPETTNIYDENCFELSTCGLPRTYSPTGDFPKKFKPQVFFKYTNGVLSGVNFEINGVNADNVVLDGALSPDSNFKLSFFVGKKVPNFVFTNAQVDNFSYTVGDRLNKLVTIEAKPIEKLSRVSLLDSLTCDSDTAMDEMSGVIKGDLITGSDTSPLKGVWIATNAYCKQQPYWDGDQIVVKVGGPHLTSENLLNQGYFKSRIPSATLSAWGITQTQALNSGIEMLVSKLGAASNGNISVVDDGDNGVILTATDLTYSFPELKIGKKVTSSGGGGGSPSRVLPNISASGSQFVLSNPLKLKDSFFMSLNPSQISSISVSQFAKLPVKTIALLSPSQADALTFNQLKALKPSQVVALKPSVIAVLDSTQIAALQPADFRLMKTTQIARISAEAAAGLAKTDLNAFTQTQLRSLTTNAVKNLEPGVLKSLSINKLRQFSPRQIGSLTDEQKSVLTRTQKKALGIK